MSHADELSALTERPTDIKRLIDFMLDSRRLSDRDRPGRFDRRTPSAAGARPTDRRKRGRLLRSNSLEARAVMLLASFYFAAGIESISAITVARASARSAVIRKT